MFKKIIFAVELLSIILLVVMMNFTTPTEIGPFGVLIFFMLVYVVCLGICTCVLYWFFWVKGVFSDKGSGVANVKKSYVYGSVVAFGPVMMLATQSFGGLNLLEVSLIVFFVIIACFLVSKRFDVVQ
jgi:hypothetical protein